MSQAYPVNFTGPLPQGGYYSYALKPVQQSVVPVGYNKGQVQGANASYSQPQPQQQPQGAYTANGHTYSSYEDYTKDMANQIDSRTNAIRGNINSGFDQYTQGLNQYEQDLGNYQTQDLGAVDQYINTAKQGLDTSKQLAYDKLGTAREQISTRGAQTIADISQNLRNMLTASNRQVSAMGGGDTGTSNTLLPYAYSKISSKERGNAQRQINDQNLQVDLKQTDVETQYNSGLQEIESTAFQQKQSIRDKYLGILGNIRQQKINAPLQKVDALNRLEEGILNQARAEFSQIQSEQRQAQQQLQSYIQTRMADLSTTQLNLGNSGNFSPQDIVYNELQGINRLGGEGGSQGGAYLMPYYKKQDTQSVY